VITTFPKGGLEEATFDFAGVWEVDYLTTENGRTEIKVYKVDD